MRRLYIALFSLATFVAPQALSSQAVVMVGNMVTRIGHQELLACNRNGRAERGDSANSTKRVKTYPNTNTDTGRYEKTGLETHAKRLNRVLYWVWVSLRTRRGAAEGGNALQVR